MLPLQSEVDISTEAQIRLLKGEITLQCKTFYNEISTYNYEQIDNEIDTFHYKNVIKVTSTITNVNGNIYEFVRIWYYE